MPQVIRPHGIEVIFKDAAESWVRKLLRLGKHAKKMLQILYLCAMCCDILAAIYSGERMHSTLL